MGEVGAFSNLNNLADYDCNLSVGLSAADVQNTS